MFLKPAGIQKKCNHCKKSLDLGQFEKHLVKTVMTAYSKCITCRPKHLASAHTSANEAAVQKRFKQSTKGKIANKRFDQSDKGKARKKRLLDTKKKRRACDPAFALMEAIGTASRHLVSGRHIESPTFLARTSFDTESQFRDHVKAAAERIGFTMSQYGDEFDVEHAIPQEAYNFSNPEDVKRCWSAANVRAMTPSDNKAKGVTLIDELCMEVGSEYFPLSWNGRLQTHDEKEAFYIQGKTLWVPPEEEDSDSNESDEEECECDDEECDESNDASE